ncbi:MAG: T9SS type A sorting domain-containing protein, partial [Cyclonatronaceae bacterium]
ANGHDRPMLVAATAHPAKFETVIEPIIGRSIPLPPDAWELVEFSPVDWAREWESQKRLIRFHHGRTPATIQEEYNDRDGHYTRDKHSTDFQSANSWSAAWVHAGLTDPVMATDLVAVTIRARDDWEAEPVLSVHRISLSTADGLNDRPDTEKWELVRQDLPVNTDRELLGTIPLTTRLHANYPNPFNPSTTLSFDLHEAGEVRLGVYDALGRRIATLTDTRLDAGTHERSWDASRYASGMYIIRLQTPHTTQTRQIMLVK